MDIVKDYIRERYQKPGDVFLGMLHRLDQPVSGVVLFARTSKAASRLTAQWQAHEVKKTYWAVVEGTLTPEQGRLESYLRKSGKRVRTAEEGAPGAKAAALEYRTLARSEKTSLVEVHLITGRKHQIRIQLSQAGCPVVGDVKYGADGFLPDKTIRLVARSLGLRHPVTGQEMTLSVDTTDMEQEFPIRAESGRTSVTS